MYSQGMIGFGHIRRNATVAYALRQSPLQPTIVMIAEAWQAGAVPMPPGVDCVTLPGLRKEVDGAYHARLLDVSNQELIGLRSSVILTAIGKLRPDVLIVDHLPIGASGELLRTLDLLRHRGTRCVLGLRDILQDRAWSERNTLDAINDYYHAVWVYGDPAVYDSVSEYEPLRRIATKLRYTGYLDQRRRLEFAPADARALAARVPPGRLVLCLVGGGRDGYALAEAFVQVELPPGTTGLVLTGPYMQEDMRDRLRSVTRARARRGTTPGRRASVEVLEFVPEPAPLIARADRVITMGGYNAVSEVLSFEKHALIVPRVDPEPEQWTRALRMQQLRLVDVLHPDDLSPSALTAWLAREPGAPADGRHRIDMDGLTRIPGLLAEQLGIPAGSVPLAI